MTKIRTATALIALAAAVSGCALVPHSLRMARVKPVRITPVEAPAAPTAEARADAAYRSASAAIWRRDYGRALDLLQEARAETPNDVRVLNAFGVVYDKLGRFDLSARYYAHALALDPNSQVVAQNMAWSAVLQGRVPVFAENAPAVAVANAGPSTPAPLVAGPLRPAVAQHLTLSGAPAAQDWAVEAAAAAVPAPDPSTAPGGLLRAREDLSPKRRAPQSSPAGGSGPRRGGGGSEDPVNGRVVQVAPGVVMLVLEEAPPTPKPLPAITGHALTIVDATGRTGAAEGVRLQLADKGWSAPRDQVRPGPVEARSSIVYPAADQRAAQALARSLARPVRLVACDDGCQGVRLVLGADWPLRPARRRS
ncbi:MAG TPA: LytR C-terminal domain-containing protein [Caulobacteraceae bacterium]|nr:LytR C-terminal domain-containing protein [Caulobacteraceae bacterium]